MKMNAWIIGGLFALASISSVATAASRWGMKELKASEKYATGVYLEVKGAKTDEEVAAALDAMEGYAVDKGLQGNSAKVRITYKEGTVKKSLNLFCHEHDPGDIDCH